MASIKKSVESLKGTGHSAAKGVTDTAGNEGPLSRNTGVAEEVVFNMQLLNVSVMLL